MKLFATRPPYSWARAIFVALSFFLSVPATADEQRAKTLWDQFRATFPNHLQIVALSERDKKNERVLLISEPPPWLGGGDINRALEEYFGSSFRGSTLQRHPIGVDGWVVDILVRFESRPSDEIWINSRIARIHKDLFGTTYKAGALRLPVSAPKDLQAPPNLTPRAAELKEWLLSDGVNLTALTNGDQSQLKKLLFGGRPDTYFTDKTGLVVLLLPTDTPIDPFLFALRHFALDTDAILGAISISGCNRIAIIGRERTASLLAMPPLRTEVMLRLAATKQRELGQSYERTAPFAGKLMRGSDAGLDWAPIYLSDDLLNTEFGSLLNITDQLLKSWSEAGRIDYFRFKYPKPKSYPFLEGAAKYVNTSALTYNWNTSGVGSVTAFDTVQVFSVLNTGSLPVSYFPEGEDNKSDLSKRAKTAEEVSYKYFAGLRDANLGTVVELAALYQIFRLFPVHVARDEQVSHVAPALLGERVMKVSAILRSIAEGTATIDDAKTERMIQLEAIQGGIPEELIPVLTNKDLPARVSELLRGSEELSKLRKLLLADRSQITADEISKLKLVRSKLLSLKELFSENVYDLLAKTMIDRSANLDPGIAQLERIARVGDSTVDLIRKVRSPSSDGSLALQVLLRLELQKDPEFIRKIQNTIWWIGGVEEAKERYQALAISAPQLFTKTPTIVLSTNSKELLSVGGHNLYSKSTSVVVDNAVPRGTVAPSLKGDETTLRMNPADASAASEVARAFERNSKASVEDLSSALSSAVKRVEPPRSVASALQLTAGDLARVDRGVSEAAQGDLAVGLSGWKVTVDKSSTLRAVQRAAGEYQVEIEKDGASYVLHRLIPNPPASVRVLSPAEFPVVFKAIAEQVANTNSASRNLVVRGTNLSSQEMQGLAQTLASGGGGGGTRFVGRTEFGMPKGERPWSAWLFKRGENARYTRKTRMDGSFDNDQITVLELSGKVENARLRLEQRLDWSKTRIESAKTVPIEDAALRGFQSESWELTIPTFKDPNASVKTRITAFFKKVVSQAQRDDLGSIITKSAGENAKVSLNAVDGISELKADILGLSKTKPEAIRFHFFDGSDDVSIAQIEGSGGVRL